MCMYIHVEPIHVYTGVDVHVHVLVNVDVALQFNRGLGATQILGGKRTTLPPFHALSSRYANSVCVN